MSINSFLVESNTRHQVFLLRRGAGLSNEVVPMLERIIQDVVGRIANTPDQIVRQQALLSELRATLRAAYTSIEDEVMAGALDLAEYEAGFQVRMLDDVATASFALPALEQIVQAVETDLMDVEPGKQMTIRQALREFGDKKSRQIVQTISDGIVTQQTNSQIAGAVGELEGLHRRQVDALVRTTTNAAADAAKRAVYRENSDLLQGVRWVSTLDSRVSLVCASRDSNIYPVDSGPRPPAHWNCRSLVTPIVREDLQIPGFEGERPAVGSDGTETVSARMTYTGFLKKQSESFQADVLGVEKAKLFRAGKITLKDMVNDLGEPLTLAELAAREGLSLGR